MTVLSVDLQKHIGDLDLHVAFESDGPVTGLFGPSGAGKTTLVNMIAGLVRPDSGRLSLGDDVLFDHDKPASTCRRIGAASAMCFRKAACFRI